MKAQSFVQQRFSAHQADTLQKFVLGGYEKELKQYPHQEVVSHGDLGYWNIIHREKNKIGIIDFGDFGYYDHSVDFVGFEDPELLNAALNEYGDSPHLRQKIDIRKKALLLNETPYYLEQKDFKMLDLLIERIKKAFF